MNQGVITVIFVADNKQLVSAIRESEGRLESFTKNADRSTRSLSDNFEDLSTSFGQIADGLGKILTASAALAVGGSFGLTAMASAAFNQVRQVENASFALKAYEKDASKVNDVLSQLVAYARSDLGVLFQRQDLFDAASTLKVYGDETSKLVDHVKVLSKGVAIGKTNFQELSEVLGGVISTGQLSGETFELLARRGIKLPDTFRNAAVSADELFEALDKALPDDLLKGRANTIDGMMIRLQSSFRDLGSAILGVDKETSKFIEGGLGDTLVKSLGDMRNILADPAMKKSFAELGQSIGAFVKDAIPALLRGFQWFVENRGTIAAAFAALVAGFVAAKIAAIGFAIAAATNPFTLIATAIVGFIGLLTFLQAKFNILGQAIAFLKPIIDPVVSVFQNLFSFLGQQLAPIIDFVKQHWDSLKNVLLVLLGVALAPLIVIMAVVVGAIAGLIAIVGAVLFVLRNLVSVAIDVGRAFAGAIGSAINNVIGFFRDLPSNALRALGNLGSFLVGAGRNLVDGLVRGIGNAAGAVTEKIKEIARGALDAIKNFFGIHSPSLVFNREIGQQLMFGLAGGITAAASSVYAAMDDVNGNLLGGFTDTVEIGFSSSALSADDAFSRNAGSSSIGGAQVVQNNYLTNGVTVDQVNRSMARELRRS